MICFSGDEGGQGCTAAWVYPYGDDGIRCASVEFGRDPGGEVGASGVVEILDAPVAVVEEPNLDMGRSSNLVHAIALTVLVWPVSTAISMLVVRSHTRTSGRRCR